MTTDKNNFLNNGSPPRSSGVPHGLRGETEDVVLTSCARCPLIDTQAIRSKILDLAIRGKLTEQLPEDGTAEELYRQIQEERNRQESTGIIKTVELAPEMTATEMPFAIPANWKWTQLGNVSYIVRGGSPRPIKQYITTREDGINWIKIGDVEKGGKYIASTHEKIIPEGEAKSRHVYPGDFLLTNSMSFGRPYISQIEGCIHDGWLLIHNLRGFVPDYLYYLLSSTYLYGQFTIKASGSTVNNLNIDKVKEAIIPLPPLAEQQRIVEKIEEAFSVLDTIDALQAQYADNLTVLKSKLIDAAIQGKLTEQLSEDGTAEDLCQQIQAEKQALIHAGKIKKEKPLPEITADEIPFEIPSNWKWVRLGSICSIINGDRGKNYPAKSTLKHEGIPFISALNLNGVSITKDEHLLCLDDCQYERLGNGKLQKDDIVICIRGSLGKHGRYPFEKGAIASSLVISRLYYSRKIMGDYEMLWLDSSAFPAEIDRYDSGTAQPNLAANNLEKFLIPLPPLAEQKRIVARLEELLPLCEKRS